MIKMLKALLGNVYNMNEQVGNFSRNYNKESNINVTINGRHKNTVTELKNAFSSSSIGLTVGKKNQ